MQISRQTRSYGMKCVHDEHHALCYEHTYQIPMSTYEYTNRNVNMFICLVSNVTRVHVRLAC